MVNPAETTPPTTDDGFDPMEFWIRHKLKILSLLGVFVVAALIYAVYEYTEKRTHNAAAQAFSAAKTADELRTVIAKHPGTAPAANAHLLLAEQLRKDGKLDESNQVLNDFINRYPTNELITGGYTSLAANQEMQKKLDEALMNYQKVTTSYPTSFSAPVAWLGQARIYKEQGKIEEAKRAYETVISQFPQSNFAAEATRQNAQLKK